MQRSNLATGRFYAAFYRWNVLTANLPPCHQANRLRQLRGRDKAAAFSACTPRRDGVATPYAVFRRRRVQQVHEKPFNAIPRGLYAIRDRTETTLVIEVAVPAGSYAGSSGRTVEYTLDEADIEVRSDGASVQVRKDITGHDAKTDEPTYSVVVSGTFDQVSAAFTGIHGVISACDYIRFSGETGVARRLRKGPVYTPTERPFDTLKCGRYVVRHLADDEVTIEAAVLIEMTTGSFTDPYGKNFSSRIERLVSLTGARVKVQSNIENYDQKLERCLCSIIVSGTPSVVHRFVQQMASGIGSLLPQVKVPVPKRFLNESAASVEDHPFDRLRRGEYVIRRREGESITIQLAVPPEFIASEGYTSKSGEKYTSAAEYMGAGSGAKVEIQSDIGRHDPPLPGRLRAVLVSGTLQQVAKALDFPAAFTGSLLVGVRPGSDIPAPAVAQSKGGSRGSSVDGASQIRYSNQSPTQSSTRRQNDDHRQSDSIRPSVDDFLRSTQIQSSSELPFERFAPWQDAIRYRSDTGVMLEVAVPGYSINKMNPQDPKGKCQALLTRHGVRMEIRDAVGIGAITSVDALRSVVLSGTFEGVRQVRDLFKQEEFSKQKESSSSRADWLDKSEVVSQSQVPSDTIDSWDFALRQRQSGTALIEFCLPQSVWDAVLQEPYGARLLQGQFDVSALVGAATPTLNNRSRVCLLLSGTPTNLRKVCDDLAAYRQRDTPARNGTTAPRGSSGDDTGAAKIRVKFPLTTELRRLLNHVDFRSVRAETGIFLSKGWKSIRLAGQITQVRKAEEIIQNGFDRAARETSSKSVKLRDLAEETLGPSPTALLKAYFMILTLSAHTLRSKLVGAGDQTILDMQEQTGCDILVSKPNFMGASSAIMIRASASKALPRARSMIEDKMKEIHGPEANTRVAEQGEGEPTSFSEAEITRLFLEARSAGQGDRDVAVGLNSGPRGLQLVRTYGSTSVSSEKTNQIGKAGQVDRMADAKSTEVQPLANEGPFSNFLDKRTDHDSCYLVISVPDKIAAAHVVGKDGRTLQSLLHPSKGMIRPAGSDKHNRQLFYIRANSQVLLQKVKARIRELLRVKIKGDPAIRQVLDVRQGIIRHDPAVEKASVTTHPHFLLCAVPSTGAAPGVLLGNSGITIRGLRRHHEAEMKVLNHLGDDQVGFYVRTKTSEDLENVRSAMQSLLEDANDKNDNKFELEVLEQGTGEPKSVDIAQLLRKEFAEHSTTVKERADARQLADSVKTTLRQFTHPVVVLTSRLPAGDGEDLPTFRGVTVSSFNAVTIQPKPIVSFNLKVPSRTWDAIEASSRVCVHVLAASPQGAAIAHAFTQPYENAHEPFERLKAAGAYISTTGRSLGPPKILRRGALVARLMVKVDLERSIKMGDHVVVVGEVYGCDEGEGVLGFDAGALAYGMQGYRELGEAVQAMELSDMAEDEEDGGERESRIPKARERAGELVIPKVDPADKSASDQAQGEADVPAQPELKILEQPREVQAASAENVAPEVIFKDASTEQTGEASAREAKESQPPPPSAADPAAASVLTQPPSSTQETKVTSGPSESRLPSQTRRTLPLLSHCKPKPSPENSSSDDIQSIFDSVPLEKQQAALLQRREHLASRPVTNPLFPYTRAKATNARPPWGLPSLERKFSNFPTFLARQHPTTASDLDPAISSLTAEEFLCPNPRPNQRWRHLLNAKKAAETASLELEVSLAAGTLTSEESAKLEDTITSNERKVAKALALRSARDLGAMLDRGKVDMVRAQWLESAVEKGQAVILEEARRVRGLLEDGALGIGDFEEAKAQLQGEHERLNSELLRLRGFVEEEGFVLEALPEEEGRGGASGRGGFDGFQGNR